MESHEICFVSEGFDDETAVRGSRGSDATLTSSLSFFGKTLAAVFLRKSGSLVVLNTVPSQKSNTMKCVSYVKMTASSTERDASL